MKRLVICCDGTWKRADEINVSNIEKIARAVDPEPSGGPVQIAYYSSGVGTGATRTDRVLGGAFGLGLDTALVGAYRFLALNYNPGDEVFVFGFSRGAYTARSLVGMISRIGLLTSDGVARNELKNAIAVYRNDTPASSKDKESFRKLCHPESDVEIGFLGVFDTVGTMGVPGLGRRKYGFHNVELAPCVRFARQALALDERRRPFTPSVWSRGKATGTDVKQVWFQGVHTDIGGGYEESELSDITLSWMMREAGERGLVFHDWSDVEPRIDPRTESHDSMTGWYELAGTVEVVGRRLARRPDHRFRQGRRILEIRESDGQSGDCDVRLAEPAYAHWKRSVEEGTGSLSNVGWWIKELERRRVDPSTRIESISKRTQLQSHSVDA
ncbi:DUF2235 domain-containing protein [Rhodococcus sp. NPDC047139]|uniref:DUF2235 domain-containing protein n=1 Tax=Rhodococcus sp. NPDC047139 TaxID=3155141 RepID=UPI0033F04C4B